MGTNTYTNLSHALDVTTTTRIIRKIDRLIDVCRFITLLFLLNDTAKVRAFSLPANNLIIKKELRVNNRKKMAAYILIL